MSDCENEVDFAKIRRLNEIGREISARITKLDKIGAKAVDMVDSIDCLLKEAEGLCDAKDFTSFKNTYCVELGRSRVYELLAIRDGRKTIEDIRAATRARVAKHRASKHVTDSASVTSSALPDDLKVNGQSVSTAVFSASAQEQIAKTI